MADPAIKIRLAGEKSPVSPPPPLTQAIIGPTEAVGQQMWPGVPLVPTMSTGATDGRFLTRRRHPDLRRLRHVRRSRHGGGATA